MIVTTDNITLFKEWLDKNTGLHFSKDRERDLLRNINSAALDFGFDKLDQFINWIVSEKLSPIQLQQLAGHFTVSETYFWREPHVFEALEKTVLPEFIYNRRKTGKKLKIWCAGCASGEEAYSLAILLKRVIPDIDSWDIQIIATDINAENLVKAQTGLYGRWSFRNVPDWLKRGYFDHKKNGVYEIKPEIKKLVRFEYLNLIESVYPSPNNNTAGIDFIFCRNVLMYFQLPKITEISSRFYNCIIDGGWFIVSSSELSSILFPKFSPINFPGAIFYKKIETTSTIQTPVFKTVVPNEITVKIPDNKIPNNSLSVNKSIENTFSEKTEPEKDDLFLKANTLFIKGNYEQVINLLSDENTIDSYRLVIKSLANLGKINEAEIIAIQNVDKFKLDATFHYLCFLIQQEKGNSDEAINELNKSIYLNPNFVMGYFSLGNIYLQQEKHNKAIKCFKTTLGLIENLPEDANILESDGLNVLQLKDILKNLISRY
jgi:chemotaxis protein methyltransferase CheR